MLKYSAGKIAVWIYCPQCWWSDFNCRPKASSSLGAEMPPDRRGKVSDSVGTNKQTVAKFHLAGCCVLPHPKKKIALWWQRGELGNRGWWVMDTESMATTCCMCCGADGPPHCSAWYPSFLICCPSPRSCRSRRRTFGVFVLPSPCVVGFLRQSLAICWIVFHTAWFVVRLCCFSGLAAFQGLRNAFWRAAVRVCPHLGLNTWVFSVCVQDVCKPGKVLKSIKKSLTIFFLLAMHSNIHSVSGVTVNCACSRLFSRNRT